MIRSIWGKYLRKCEARKYENIEMEMSNLGKIIMGLYELVENFEKNFLAETSENRSEAGKKAHPDRSLPLLTLLSSVELFVF